MDDEFDLYGVSVELNDERGKELEMRSSACTHGLYWHMQHRRDFERNK